MRDYEAYEAVWRMVYEYAMLLQQQNAAPDWPYPGMPYRCSESAEDQRWEFWADAREWYPETLVDTAYNAVWD